MRLREDLAFARQGLELLDRKKDSLMVRIYSLSSKAERLRCRMNASLEGAYGHFRRTLAAHGRLACERVSLGNEAGVTVQVQEKSFMGVSLPVVRIVVAPLMPPYGFLETGLSMDALAASLRHSLAIVAELAEVEIGLFRLVMEMRKTIKRINALENILIPLYEGTVKHMEESLEEKERESVFQLKRRRNRREEEGDEGL
ncbi:MAG: V-type ATP synthase subunit D [Deltaproteobacteria bacterium]|nr:V-type ATP synthase subunit D [Deltaproteobacteria bacterium]